MDDCPVCLESLKEKLSIRIPCSDQGHVLCMRCFIHLEKRDCPLCRTHFERFIPDIDKSVRIALIEFIKQLS